MLTKEEIVQAARTLDPDEKCELIEHLEADIRPTQTGSMSSAEFVVELNRRWEELVADPSKGVDLEDAVAELRRKYSNHG